MKKLILALSFVFVLGLVAVNAQDKKEVKKAPAKTEQTTVKPAATAKMANASKTAKPGKKVSKSKKVVAPVKK